MSIVETTFLKKNHEILTFIILHKFMGTTMLNQKISWNSELTFVSIVFSFHFFLIKKISLL